MLFSYNWLKEYIGDKMPDENKLVDLLTFHSFEVESSEKVGGDTILEIDILPNRTHDSLGHFFIAKEIGALIGVKIDPYKKKKRTLEKTTLKVEIEDANLCKRYIGRIIKNIEVKDSPEWTQKRITSIGQKPINNMVDFANYTMYSINQPMHVFDADKVDGDTIYVRNGKQGEEITTLDGDKISIDNSILVIADRKGPLAIAGIKGGTKAQVTKDTKNIILEAANFDPVSIRKTSHKLNLKTDSSKRFENEISPELASIGIDYVTDLATKYAGSDKTFVQESVDIYKKGKRSYRVGVSQDDINRVLGIKLSGKDLENILDKLGFSYEKVSIHKKIIEEANKHIGKKYKLGASVSYEAPNIFDCSSFVSYVFSTVGISVPRISIDQYVFSNAENRKPKNPGEIVFANSGNGKIYTKSVEFLPGTEIPIGIDHCGIYLGNGKVAQATTKNGVVIGDISEFKNMVGVGNVIKDKERYVVTIPDERLDLMSSKGFFSGGNVEDLIEEIGRIYGYENIKSKSLSKIDIKPKINKIFYYEEKIRSILSNYGFSEVYNSSYTKSGDIELENPQSMDKPFMRNSLSFGLLLSQKLNKGNADLLGLDSIRVFEIGTVFTKNSEYRALGISTGDNVDSTGQKIVDELFNKLDFKKDKKLIYKIDKVTEINITEMVKQLPDVDSYENLDFENIVKYKPFSIYPYISRDISIWVPIKIREEIIKEMIIEKGGNLLINIKKFDEFKKGNIKSYAFRLIFQSFNKTLSDLEVNKIIGEITDSLNKKEGFSVR